MELYPVSQAQLEQIHKSLGTSKEKVAEDVAILVEWITKQPHLPQTFPFDHFLTRALSVSKFNVEKAKRKIDQFFTLRGLNKELYVTFGTDSFLPPIKNSLTLLPLPNLGPLNERIFMLFANTPSTENYDYDHYSQLVVSVVELAALYDRTGSVRIFGDGKWFNFDYIKKVEWNKLYRSTQLIVNGYGGKIVRFDIINPLPAADILFHGLKKLFKNKIVQRVVFHKNMESLYESLPLEYLPEDYGGSNGKISDLQEKLSTAVEAHRDYLANGAEYVSDESLRIGKVPYQNDIFGVDGTFKALSLD